MADVQVSPSLPANIERVALGTAYSPAGSSSNWHAFADVALAEGDLLIVTAVGTGAPNSWTWNGVSLSVDVLSVRSYDVSICSLKVTAASAGTADLILGTSNNTVASAMVLRGLTGATDVSRYDNLVDYYGDPATLPAVRTRFANEYFVAVVGLNGVTSAPGTTWDNGFTEGQRLGHDFENGYAYLLIDAFRFVEELKDSKAKLDGLTGATNWLLAWVTYRATPFNKLTVDAGSPTVVLPDAYVCPIVPGIIQSEVWATLASGQNMPHCTLVIGDYVYVGLMTNPGKIVKIKLSDPSDKTTLAFANSSSHMNVIQMRYLVATGLIYCIFSGSNSCISSVNPSTLAVVDLAFLGDTTNAPLATDGTYLYIGRGGGSGLQPTPITRLLLDGSDDPGTNLDVDLGAAKFFHAMDYDPASDKLYATATNISGGGGSIVRVDRETFAVEEVREFDAAFAVPTDDLCFAGNHVYIGLESAYCYGKILKIEKANLDNITVIATGVQASCYGTFYFPPFIWCLFANGTIARIDPSTGNFRLARFNDQAKVNELASAGTSFYLTVYETTARILVLDRLAMETGLWSEPLLLASAGSVTVQTPSETVYVSGSAASASAGSVSVVQSITVTLTGASASASAGSVALGGDISCSLTGSSVTISSGSPSVTGTEFQPLPPGAFPVDPDFVVVRTAEPHLLRRRLASGFEAIRQKSTGQRIWSLTFGNRPLSEFEAVEAFRRKMGASDFPFLDRTTGDTVNVTFASEPRFTERHTNLHDWSVDLIEFL